MIVAEPEDVRFAFWTGISLGLVVGPTAWRLLRTATRAIFRKTRKPPMARSTHFSNHGKVSNWKLPPNAR